MKVLFATSLNEFYTQNAYQCLRYQCKDIYEYWNRIKIFPEDYDLGISFLYRHKIPADQLNKTWINFHPAPLPDYKGRNVAYHAILNGVKEWGGTLHYIDENFDTGPIIDIKKFSVDDNHTANDLIFGSYQMLLDMFKKYVPRFLLGEKVKATSQIVNTGKYYKQTILNDFIDLDIYQQVMVRALTAKNFYPKVKIGSTIYKIVKE